MAPSRVSAGGCLLSVREGSLDGDGLGSADDGAGSLVGLLAGGVLAVVVDLVGANSSHVHNVARDLDVLGDVAVDHVGAGGASVNVVVVAGSLDVPGAVVGIGSLEDGDDGLGLVKVDEGTAGGGLLASVVLAGVLEEVGAGLEHVELGASGVARAGLLPSDSGGGLGALVVASGAGVFLHEFLDVLVVLGIACGVLDDDLGLERVVAVDSVGVLVSGHVGVLEVTLLALDFAVSLGLVALGVGGHVVPLVAATVGLAAS